MKKALFFTLGISLLLTPLFTFAHGSSYLEFNPDRSNSIKVVDVATPSQVFFAQNDFLGGFDIWVANPGSSGTATFALLNEQGIVLTSKTVTIPTIALTSSGTKFHVDLNSQLPVLADEKYSIRLTTSMSELRLYYSDRIQIVSHNTPFVSEYMIGVAKLGAEEQYFSFKYALHETNESSAPIISNIGWTVISETQMKISFNTNEAVDYRLEYGPDGEGYAQSTNFLGGYEFCTEGLNICDIIIPVTSDTTYQYRLTVKDIWNNQSQSTGTFSSGQGQTPVPTTIQPDQPPVISNLRVAEVTNNSVGIAWTTNEISSSYLLISFSTDLITITAESDPTFELEHFLGTDPVLGSGVTYIATIRALDLSNNETKATLNFTTLSIQPSPSPSPSQTPLPPPLPTTPSPTVSGSPASLPSTTLTPQPSGITTSSSPSGDGGGTGTVQWNPPAGGEPNDGYRVDVFDKDGKLIKTVFAPSGSHNVEIPELADGEYDVIVYTNDEGVFKKVEKPAKLSIGEPSFTERLISFWPYLTVVVVLGGVLYWLMKRRSSQVHQSPVS